MARRARWAVAVVLGLTLTVSGVARAIDVTGTWRTCLHCTFGIICEDAYDTWTFVQTGTTFTLTTDSAPGFSFTGTIDPMSGAFMTDPNFVVFTGTATQSTITGSYESLALGTFNGLRDCDPMTPGQCDDGDTCTIDTCSSTGIAPCDASMPGTTVDACTYALAPGCTSTSTTTSTSSTTTTIPDFPVDGVKLVVRKSLASGRETVKFITRDTGLGFPPFGSGSDPRSIGVVVDLLSQSEGYDIPSSIIFAGDTRWQTKPAPATYRFTNSSAPAGGSGVKKLLLVQGRMLKVDAAEHGLDLMNPQLSLGIRITMGQYETCARFGPATIRTDQFGRFVARNATAPADCSNESLLGP